MSRIGKMPIEIPSGVTVEIKDSQVTVTGAKGTLSQSIPEGIKVEVNENQVNVTRANDEKKQRALHGLIRSLVNNMVEGVSKGFSKTLEVNGVGFKANMAGDTLKLSLGFSHDIDFKVPQNISIEAKNNVITVSGFDKQQVGQVSAKIRAFKKPEPYKGKGIKYADEYIIRKAGKAAGA